MITQDWGAFTETVVHGVTGYRVRTFSQLCWAIQHMDDLDRFACHRWARANYSLERVAGMYEEYFSMLFDLWTKEGWYAQHRPASLEWLKLDHDVLSSTANATK